MVSKSFLFLMGCCLLALCYAGPERASAEGVDSVAVASIAVATPPVVTPVEPALMDAFVPSRRAGLLFETVSLDSAAISLGPPGFVPRDSSDKLSAPELNLAEPDINWLRFGVSTASLAAGVTLLHIYQANAWWSNDRGRFHVFDDPTYKANFDKLGHGFGGYYSSHFFDEAFTWSGFDSVQSAILGATCGALWELYIELEDGFAKNWGFSPGDAKADLIGAGFFLARRVVPGLEHFKYKWSYWPSQQLLENRPDIQGQSLNIIEDYGGQEYWLSIDVDGLLPQSAKPYWPDWLKVAIGAAGYNLDAVSAGPEPFKDRKIAWMVSLDYDLGSIIPKSDIGILNFIRRGLDYWHFPAPAFRIAPSPRFYILFPFRMSIG